MVDFESFESTNIKYPESMIDSVEWKEKLKTKNNVVLPRPPDDKLKYSYLKTRDACLGE